MVHVRWGVALRAPFQARCSTDQCRVGLDFTSLGLSLDGQAQVHGSSLHFWFLSLVPLIPLATVCAVRQTGMWVRCVWREPAAFIRPTVGLPRWADGNRASALPFASFR